MPTSANSYADLFQPVLIAIAVYVAAGLVVGGIALIRMAPKADPALRGSPMSVRFILLPGVIAVWPLAIARWHRSGRGIS